MSHKRSNNAVWKIAVPDNVTPKQRIDQIIKSYKALSTAEPSKYKVLTPIQVQQTFGKAKLTLYVRSRPSQGFRPFVADYLVSESDGDKFTFTVKDVCLFIATERSLFVITSGSGYRIIENYVDYSFPFDTAKKIVANNFKAAETREFSGSTTSKTETYRRGYSIAKSESFGKVWKRLVGRLSSGLLPEGSYLREIINPNKPPAVEVKSSFTLRKSLDLSQIVSLVNEIEALPDPTEEQAKQLSFLDNLYPVKNKDLNARLHRCLIEGVRQNIISGTPIDLDVCDPDDISRYYAGSNFKVSRWKLEGDPPEKDHLLKVLKQECQAELGDEDTFFEKIMSLKIRYTSNDDEDGDTITMDLNKFLHGQVNCDGETYFLLDKVWYRSQGEFLDNLKKDFIEETFNSSAPILHSPTLGLLPWDNGDEDAYNKRQAEENEFYYGDKIFAVSDRGQVELFDLLKVDSESDTLYVIHVKEDFDAKMRDACSQITIASEVIESDRVNNKVLLAEYYDEWVAAEINRNKGISKEVFLSWFDMRNTVYVVLCSTALDFIAQTFESNRLYSHIARREVIATRNELKGHGRTFRLAHTKRVHTA